MVNPDRYAAKVAANQDVHRRRIEREQRLESMLEESNRYIDDVTDKGLKSKLKYMMNMYIDDGGTKKEYKQRMHSYLKKL